MKTSIDLRVDWSNTWSDGMSGRVRMYDATSGRSGAMHWDVYNDDGITSQSIAIERLREHLTEVLTDTSD